MVILTTDNRVLHVSRASRVSLLGNLPEGISLTIWSPDGQTCEAYVATSILSDAEWGGDEPEAGCRVRAALRLITHGVALNGSSTARTGALVWRPPSNC